MKLSHEQGWSVNSASLRSSAQFLAKIESEWFMGTLCVLRCLPIPMLRNTCKKIFACTVVELATRFLFGVTSWMAHCTSAIIVSVCSREERKFHQRSYNTLDISRSELTLREVQWCECVHVLGGLLHVHTPTRMKMIFVYVCILICTVVKTITTSNMKTDICGHVS